MSFKVVKIQQQAYVVVHASILFHNHFKILAYYKSFSIAISGVSCVGGILLIAKLICWLKPT